MIKSRNIDPYKFSGENMKLKYPALLAALCVSSVQATSVFINEIHYDNIGSDTGEFIEIAAPQGTDLNGWTVELYNGNNGTEYATKELSGVMQGDSGGYGFITVDHSGIQNGDPDGMALIDAEGNVVQFLSYEGSFIATNATAAGLTSDDIGVTEPDSTPVGFSLQLSGSGTEYADFSWQAAATETPGSSNNDQSFSGVVTDTAPTVTSISPADGDLNVAVDADVSVTFSEAVVITGYNSITCESEASITVTASGEGASYVLNPDQDFTSGDTCSFTISANDVTDLDDESDNLAEDVTVTFSVIDTSVSVELVINEFQADPAGDISGDANGDGTRDSSQDEFVEIVNPTEADIDVSGWTLSDAGSVRHTFPEGSVIEAGCAVVVFGGDIATGTFGGSLVQTASNGYLSFNNSGDTITVTNGVSTFEVVYGSEGGNNQSLTLNPDITGEAYSAHSSVEAANGALFSPGTKLDGTKFAGCTIPDIAPTVVDITPADGATEVGVDSVISLSFSEEVTVSEWPNLVCELSGEVALDGALSGTEYTLTPATELDNNDTCTLTLSAASVADVDGTPDMMASDFVSRFSTSEVLSVMFIHEVQGSGNASDLVGQTVLVQAIVTAVLPDSNVFYVQEEDVDADASPATSEGILVFTDGVFDMPAVGDLIEVRGLVSEFFNRTQITLSSAPSLIAENSALPSAASLTLPVASLDDLEALEGMLVTSSVALIVTDTFTLGRFGQAVLSSKRLYNPTNIFTPGSAEAIALAQSNSLDRVLLDDGNDNQNPEVVPFPTGGLSAVNPLRMGDTVAALTGVVDYSFSDYRVIPTQYPTFVATNPRTNAPDLTLGNLKVASLNVLNFFNTIDTGARICGPASDADCRGADDNGTDGNGLTEFERQKVKTVAAIVAMDADIVGLMEIENDGFGAQSAIVELVDGINIEMGEGTYAVVDAGGTIGTDAITVALLYKPASVTLSGQVQILTSLNSISDGNGALFDDSKNRPSVVQKFALVENGEELVVSVNHLKSKGSSCGTGDDDETTGQGNCNLTRTRAAQALTAFITEQFGTTPALIIGDLNAYAKEDPISAIIGEGYTDLANYFGGAEAYSYSFDGQLGYLDHALASASMLEKVVDTTEWHINADEPIVLDYNLDFQSATQIDKYFAPDAYRMSDHDPVVIALQFDVEVETVVGDVNGDGVVDMNDYFAFIGAYGSSEGDGAYKAAADMNSNGIIDMTDFQLWYQVFLAP
jgi:predicted extracellular nuclease